MYIKIKEASEAVTRRYALETNGVLPSALHSRDPLQPEIELKLLSPWTCRCPHITQRKQTKPQTNQKVNEDGKHSCRIGAVFAKTQGTRSQVVLLKCHIPRGNSKTLSQEQLHTRVLKIRWKKLHEMQRRN